MMSIMPFGSFARSVRPMLSPLPSTLALTALEADTEFFLSFPRHLRQRLLLDLITSPPLSSLRLANIAALNDNTVPGIDTTHKRVRGDAVKALKTNTAALYAEIEAVKTKVDWVYSTYGYLCAEILLHRTLPMTKRWEELELEAEECRRLVNRWAVKVQIAQASVGMEEMDEVLRERAERRRRRRFLEYGLWWAQMNMVTKWELPTEDVWWNEEDD